MHKIIDIDFGSTRYEELVELRYKVLLEPLGLKFLDSHRDKEINYLHVGCIDNLDNTLIGGMMLIPLSNDTIRMMQVAVSDKHQGSGVGRDLVAHAEKRAEKSGYKKLVMHAMLNVVGFWEKLGYTQEGDIFEEKGIYKSFNYEIFERRDSIVLAFDGDSTITRVFFLACVVFPLVLLAFVAIFPPNMSILYENFFLSYL